MRVKLTVLTILLAGVALAELDPVLVNAHQISVPNVMGVHKITSSLEYTPLVVTYGETAVAANQPVNVVRAATNLVFTANLLAGDQLFVYDHARSGYVTYRLTAEKTWEPETVFSGLEGTKDMTPLANQAQSWGYGFWVRRPEVASRTDKTIWLAGQVSVGQVSITLPPSESWTTTLIGNPLGAAWDLSDKSIIDWSTVATVNDHIQLNDGSAVLYYWKTKGGVTGWHSVSATKGSGVIPAGAAFWYVRAKPANPENEQDPITINFRTGL